MAGAAKDEAALLHGTCVALGGRAALLRGRSGAGKSDLALRFITAEAAAGAALVADDQVQVRREAGRLVARPPATIAGRIEVRGIGIIDVAHTPEAELVLVVDLVARRAVPRLPHGVTVTLLGIELPLIKLSPFDASAGIKLKLALERAGVIA